MIGGIAFSQFFLQTLYMQDVLGYSAIRTGVGFATMTFTIIVFSNVAQRLVTRIGVRSGARPTGLLLDSVSLALLHAAPGERALLLEPVPGHADRRRRAGVLVRARHDRRADRRQPGRRGRGLGPHQHEPPGRRRGGAGRRLDDRLVLRDDRIPGRRERRPHAGLPGRVPRALRHRARGRRDRRRPARPRPSRRRSRASPTTEHRSRRPPDERDAPARELRRPRRAAGARDRRPASAPARAGAGARPARAARGDCCRDRRARPRGRPGAGRGSRR